MPRFLSRQNAVLTDEQHYATKQNQVQVSQDKERNTKIDTTNTKLDDLKNQQDGVIGAINNTTIGDGTLGQRTYVYAHDTSNGVARALKCDSSGRLETSVDALEVTAETINLSTDTLEAKTQAITDKLDTLAGAGNNTVGEGSSKLQTYLYGRDVGNGLFRPLVCDSDAHLQVDVLSTALPSGGATEATLAAAEAHAGNIETSVQLMDDVVTAQNAAHPSKANAVGGRYYVDNTFRDIRVDDIGKVIVDSPAGSDINTRLDNIVNNTSSISDAEVHLSAIDTNIVNAEAHLGLIDSNMGQAELHLSALDTNFANRIPTTIGPKDESLSFTICRNNTTGAFDSHARTDITDRATSKALLCNTSGELLNKGKTNKSNGSEVTYVSGQSISGSGTHEGSAIAIDPNTNAIFAEFNFSHTGITFEVLGSIDGSNFFSTGVQFNAGGMSPATLTGLETILGTSTSVHSFPPHIKFKFTNSDSSAQTATLSYVIQSS